MVNWIIILSLIGIILSAYAFYVRKKSLSEKDYKAICDFNEKVSCSKVLSHEKGAVVGVSNSVFGFFYYLIIIFLSFFGLGFELKILSGAGVLVSIYLGFVLATKIKKACVVCITTYLINLAIFVLALTQGL